MTTNRDLGINWECLERVDHITPRIPRETQSSGRYWYSPRGDCYRVLGSYEHCDTIDHIPSALASGWVRVQCSLVELGIQCTSLAAGENVALWILHNLDYLMGDARLCIDYGSGYVLEPVTQWLESVKASKVSAEVL